MFSDDLPPLPVPPEPAAPARPKPELIQCGHTYRLVDPTEPDWKHVAVSVARAALGNPPGAFHLLTTPERDALEAAMRDAPEPDPLMPARDAAERWG